MKRNTFILSIIIGCLLLFNSISPGRDFVSHGYIRRQIETHLRPRSSSFQTGPLRAGLTDRLAAQPDESQFVDISPFDEVLFQRVVGSESLGSIQRQIRLLGELIGTGKRPPVVWHINSAQGAGGVSDILNGLASLSLMLGLDSRWFVIKGDDLFFGLTKKWHNVLHNGNVEVITDEELEHYREVTDFNVKRLMDLKKREGVEDPDFIILHDQQPLGMIGGLREAFPKTKFIWRGHIPYKITTDRSRRAWEFLSRYVNRCDAAVVHLPEYRPPGLKVPVFYIQPGINPAGLINRKVSDEFISATFKKYGIRQENRRIVLQVGRFDRFKDHIGVVESYLQAVLQLIPEAAVIEDIPKLVLLGPMAPDDPEGIEVYTEIKHYADLAEREIQTAIAKIFGPEAARKSKQNIHVQPLLTAPGVEDRLGEELKKKGLNPGVIRPIRLTEEQLRHLSELQRDIFHARTRAGKKDNTWSDYRDVDILQEIPPNEWHELEVSAFQDRADVILIKSTAEGFGLSCTGAGFHGKPRIVSAVGGLRKQIRHGETGFLVGQDKDGNFHRRLSISQAAAVLRDLMLDKRKRLKIGSNAREDVIEHSLLDRHLRDWLSLFEAIIKDRRAGGSSGNIVIRNRILQTIDAGA